MLTVFFAANAEEANALIESGTLDPAAAGLPSVDAGGVSPMALVRLDAAITGADADAIVDDVLHEPLANIDDGEQLLFRARHELTRVLAHLTDVDRPATSWAAADEMAADGYAATDCATIIRDLAALAAQAESDRRELYTWLCV